MTNCLTSIGEGIATGMRLLATALTANPTIHHASSQMYQPQYYGGYALQHTLKQLVLLWK